MKLTVDVYYSEERDTEGRPVGWMDGYKPGHKLRYITSFEVENKTPWPSTAAEVAWREMNRVDGNEHISRANIEERSMCVGDVIRIARDVQVSYWMAVADVGFVFIPKPSNFVTKEEVQ